MASEHDSGSEIDKEWKVVLSPTDAKRGIFAIETTVVEELYIGLENSDPPGLVADDDFEARLCELVVGYAESYGLSEKRLSIFEGLRNGLKTVTNELVLALQTLLFTQEGDYALIGSEPAYTELLLGICYERLRQPDQAVKSIRSAITRFQQFGDDTVYGVMIEALCRMAQIYRFTDKKDSARACMKQAFRILSFAKNDWSSHYRLLAEMAALMTATGNYEAAITAYRRLLKTKADIGRKYERSTVDILLKLSTLYHTAHNLYEAEQALICAGVLYHELPVQDENQFVEIVQKLSGILFQSGEFIQSELVSERANQIIGRAGSSPSHQILGDMLNMASSQRKLGDPDEARKLYRKALMTLEAQREKRIVDRLPILAGIYLLTSDKQALQRASLLGDMEESLNQFFCRPDVPTHEGLNKVAAIYNLLGYFAAANDLREVAERITTPLKLVQSSNLFIELTAKEISDD